MAAREHRTAQAAGSSSSMMYDLASQHAHVLGLQHRAADEHALF
jgi:hypothetical protein